MLTLLFWRLGYIFNNYGLILYSGLIKYAMHQNVMCKGSKIDSTTTNVKEKKNLGVKSVNMKEKESRGKYCSVIKD
ncbi:hypothetical protein PR048_007356 [Dryococelus australis]|uniref:Uncharacterized protein n=1 Tax=Dryococelus australis TaxID=614101 RepID=A0ABQ9IDJ5_9NEOP|nr:hypothetical protein PR048_007356 [Dryococelus australis]